MFTVVGEHVFPFLRTGLAKQLGNGDSTYATHMKDARFTIPTAALLAKVVDMLDKVPMEERDTKGEAVPEADPDDARELLNYRRAFEFVSTYLEEGAPITEGLVREIHKHLVEGVRGGSAAPGEYRRVQNYVVNSATQEVVYTPPPAHDVPILRGNQCKTCPRSK